MSVTLVTAQGKQVIANAIANNTKVKIAKIAVGDGNGTIYIPTESQTALRNKKWEGTLNSAIINPTNVNEIIFEGKIAAGVGGFYIREVGLFDENNVLIGISDFPESFKAVADQYEVFVRMILKVASTNAIVNVNNDLVFATQKYVVDAVKKVADIANAKADKSVVTTSENGLMSATDKVKLDSLQNADVSGLATKTELTNHANSTTHITAAERTKWNKVVEDEATHKLDNTLHLTNGYLKVTNGSTDFLLKMDNDGLYLEEV